MRARLVPLLLAMTAVASGCAGGGQSEVTAAPLPPATASPTPLATATPLAAEVPAEANEATPEGAAEFIRFFFSQLELAYAEANPDLVAALSAPGCTTCQNYIDSLTVLREDAGSVKDYLIRVESVEPAGVDEAGEVTAVVVLDVGEYVRRDATGQITTREEPATGAVQDVRLVRVAGEWLVGEVTQ